MIDDKVINVDELATWLRYHRCDVKKLDNLLEIKVPLACVHLGFDEDEGIYFCKIYDKRPLICREFFCKRAKEG